MKGVLPSLGGVLFLLAGVGLTWLVADSSYTYPCRLSLELDNYACWGLMGLPLAAGIGSMALGGAVLLRGILALRWPTRFRVLNPSKIVTFLGLLLFAGIFALTVLLFKVFAFGFNLSTFLFLTFIGILVFTIAQWIQLYLHPHQEFEGDSTPPNQ